MSKKIPNYFNDFLKVNFKTDKDFEYYLQQMDIKNIEDVDTIDVDFERFYGNNDDEEIKYLD